jgi:hypothetical protein
VKKLFFILFLFVVVFLGCKKPSVLKRPEFIGYWRTLDKSEDRTSIDIGEDGQGRYSQKLDGEERRSYDGEIYATDKKLKIGRINHFEIIEYPHNIDTTVEHIVIYDYTTQTQKAANWKMILSCHKPSIFSNPNEVYYKADY